MKRIALFIAFAVLALAIGVPASAATGTIGLNWTLPTVGTSGAPLTGADALTGIDVYLSTSPIPDDFAGAPTVALAAGAQTTTQTMVVANGATIYARLKARNATGSSVFTSQVSKVVVVPNFPGAPTSVTITLTIS